MGLPKVFGRREEPPVEMLDLETLKSRIGEPLPPTRPTPPESPGAYRRSDGRAPEKRSWRKVAGLTR